MGWLGQVCFGSAFSSNLCHDRIWARQKICLMANMMTSIPMPDCLSIWNQTNCIFSRSRYSVVPTKSGSHWDQKEIKSVVLTQSGPAKWLCVALTKSVPNWDHFPWISIYDFYRAARKCPLHQALVWNLAKKSQTLGTLQDFKGQTTGCLYLPDRSARFSTSFS